MDNRCSQTRFSPATWHHAVSLIKASPSIALIGPQAALYHHNHVRQLLAKKDDYRAAETAIFVCLGMLRVALRRGEEGAVEHHSDQRVSFLANPPSVQFWDRLLREYGVGPHGTMERLLEGCKCLNFVFSPNEEDGAKDSPH